MDRDRRVSDAQYQARKAVFDACINASQMEHDWHEAREEMYLDLLDPGVHYLAFQYSMEGKGNEWASLGQDVLALIERLSNDDYWYAPHYVVDLDTGRELHWRATYQITGTSPAYEHLVKEMLTDGGDQLAFLGIDNEDPAHPLYGRCDTCGSPCDHRGCTVERTHQTAIP